MPAVFVSRDGKLLTKKPFLTRLNSLTRQIYLILMLYIATLFTFNSQQVIEKYRLKYGLSRNYTETSTNGYVNQSSNDRSWSRRLGSVDDIRAPPCGSCCGVFFTRKYEWKTINTIDTIKRKKNQLSIKEQKNTVYPLAFESRKYTVSVALPGSIIANSQGLELKTLLAGQIARALAIFCVDEIIVFNESGKSKTSDFSEKDNNTNDPNVFLTHLLQYIETPQYLRKILFPIHRDLRFAGLLNPLDCPHHLRIDEDLPYREGVTLDSLKYSKVFKHCTLVEAGLKQKVIIPEKIKPGVRVTLSIKKSNIYKKGYISANVVSSSEPRETMGYYWGYTVRLANSLSEVLTGSSYENGYDLSIGTSERGVAFEEIKDDFPNFNHILIVLGGPAGLEAAVDADEDLDIGGDRADELFDRWINTCPMQGSRTIRTEEALLITLAQLKTVIMKKGRR
ncbi:hypothetical protein PCANB_002141 [Pneumocystis canis]|nr:hypothetical protein PCANB_002141 [Pneumocystis canis]